MERARSLWSQADLVLWCGDGEHGFCDVPLIGNRKTQRVLKVGMKSDLGWAIADGECGVDLHVSGETGDGVAKLAAAIAERLVPKGMRSARERGRFWGGLVTE
jgi:tRNA U34 5-carboxymethylaminomethyl modifying GTPase MnmE/TrmE